MTTQRRGMLILGAIFIFTVFWVAGNPISPVVLSLGVIGIIWSHWG